MNATDTSGEGVNIVTAPTSPTAPGPPAGAVDEPRTWTVELPDRLLLLNANDRLHWRVRRDRTAAIRTAAWALAKQMKIPLLARAYIVAEYCPTDRRRRDPANWAPTAKAAVDGLVDAGVLPDDSAEYLDGPDMRLGLVTPGGRRFLLHITELEVS